MGVSIRGYRKAKRVDMGIFDADGEPIDRKTGTSIKYDAQVFANPDFPGRDEGVVSECFYISDEACEVGLMGYGRYSVMRNVLAKVAGYPEMACEIDGFKHMSNCVACWSGESGPFSELINFSDCDGVIGPVVSKKLAGDFADFQEKADAFGSDEFSKFYAGMRQAFEFAAQDGFVTFG